MRRKNMKERIKRRKGKKKRNKDKIKKYACIQLFLFLRINFYFLSFMMDVFSSFAVSFLVFHVTIIYLRHVTWTTFIFLLAVAIFTNRISGKFGLYVHRMFFFLVPGANNFSRLTLYDRPSFCISSVQVWHSVQPL